MKQALALAAAIALAACGGKKQADPGATGGGSGSDPGRGAAGGPADPALARCLTTLERAAALPAADRAAAIVRGCPLCGRAWDPVLATDHADTAPVDLEAVWQVVDACGGTCTNQAAGLFRNQLAELGPGMPATRPWRLLAGSCKRLLRADDRSERFVSAPWYALVMIGDRLHAARASLPAADQARLDAALAHLLLPLPPVTAPGTAFAVPGGGLQPGTPWRQITLTADAAFVGRLPFAHLSSAGLVVVDGGHPYPGPEVARAELAAALEAQLAATAPAPPELPGRIDAPILIAPRAAPARIVLDAVAALGPHRAHRAVSAPRARSALWRPRLVAATRAPGRQRAPAGCRLRLAAWSRRASPWSTAARGRCERRRPCPTRPPARRARWTCGGERARRRPRDRAGRRRPAPVESLSVLLDAAAGGAAALAVPAPARAALTGGDLPAFDEAALAAALAAAP
ncbi:MAG: hypothetical protein HS111_01525 [Kofleriaceae bacterium]|nr:hypothetical protein [Kofleriaceae bacterium]